MPLPIILAHKIMKRQSELRKDGTLEWLLPDAKSQVTVRYENEVPVAIDTVVVSTQHKASVTQATIRQEVIDQIILPVINEYLQDSQPELLINPSGSFTIGGPHGDTGLTGRKIIVDTYGGSCAHGGGAFSGKDASKVDRSAAYAARYVAKHIVASGIADRCTIQISYAIGKEEPTSLLVNLHGTGKVEESKLTVAISQLFDLRPNGIAKMLGLKNPIYLPTAAYGHFGKESLPWEILNENIIKELSKLSF
jgi:S-adenosylmethionine synthetase